VGVVVDDTAVTPRYAIGFTPDRELPIVWKIALGSLRNKFLFLVPGALLLSAFAPWAVTPILMTGGAYLCFEAAEKIFEAIVGGHEVDEASELALGSAELERAKVSGAIRTDLILSAEIVAISLASVEDQPLTIQAAALVAVSLGITAGVYGVVGLIVKMDDIGLHLAQRKGPLTRRTGSVLVKAMPTVLSALTVIGTGAMLWVGGGIILHGLERYRLTPLAHWAHALQVWGVGVGGAVVGWLAFAAMAAMTGLLVGAVAVGAVQLIGRLRGKH
jgi:predicted DNA repair protein MutK